MGPRLKAMGNRTASLLLLRTMPIKPRAPTKSWVLPGVIRKASGRPISSVSAWILVVCPPRERPIALLKAPLLRRPRSHGL